MSKQTIAVIGLGYVGLPVAVAFSKYFDVIGFDVDSNRIKALKTGFDWTGEISKERLEASSMSFTDQADSIGAANFFVVTVPTPVDDSRKPDFTMMLNACVVIGNQLKKGSIVVFESTVYPGATEEICGPELERVSGLRCGIDFKLGYSPERINPGDTEHPLEKIVKIVSGQDSETLEIIADVYGKIIDAGVYKVTSIKVAEAAKVLENTQRDINIALMNEMAKICDLVGIRTNEVLAAAGTKWNFLKFSPGLVGGHCIGVDPYYLTSKAEQLDYHPEVILSGRRINDGMAKYIVNRLIKMLAWTEQPLRSARVGIMGITFKEGVPDIRNSKVVDIYEALQQFGINPIVHDPMANHDLLKRSHNISVANLDELDNLDLLIVAVPHQEYKAMAIHTLCGKVRQNGIIADIRSCLNPEQIRTDIRYWSL